MKNDTTTTVSKIVMLRYLTASSLVADIFPIIREYLFFDRTSMVFARKRAEIYHDVHRMIRNAQSRRNGFFHQEEEDTEHPHWIFCCPEHHVILQAFSCMFCGDYVISNRPIPEAVVCRCH